MLQSLAGTEVGGRGQYFTEEQKGLKHPAKQQSAVSVTLKCTKLTGLPVTTGEGWKKMGVLPRLAPISLYLGTGKGCTAGAGPRSQPSPRNGSGGVREQQDNIRHFSRSRRTAAGHQETSADGRL